MPEYTPRIAHQSQIPTATLTASPATTEADGPTANLKDWLPWTFWRPTGTGPFVLTAVFTASASITTAALAGHDASGSVTVETWNGSAWVAWLSATAAGDGRVLYLTGEARTTDRVRVTVNTLTHLAVLFVGADLILPTGVAPGWTDPDLAQRATLRTERSRGGVWLGAAVDLWQAKLDLSIKNVDQYWVRDTWRPFLRQCSTQPFLLSWFEAEWPTSGCLCTEADFGSTAFSARGFCDVSVSFDADTGLDRRATP